MSKFEKSTQIDLMI